MAHHVGLLQAGNDAAEHILVFSPPRFLPGSLTPHQPPLAGLRAESS